MNSFLQKQSQYLLQNELYALILVAVLAVIPFASWLSLAAIALITLRKGSYDGFKVLVVGIMAAVIITVFNRTISVPYTLPAVLLTFLLGYLAAYFLRITASWKLVVALIIGLALISMVLVHWFFSNYITEQFQSLLVLFESMEQSSSVLRLLDGKHGITHELLANYLLGIKALSIVVSALSSLMLARYIQSLLFYPGGFRKEILAFRASRIGVFLLIICAAGVYENNPVAISCLPILVVYLLATGIGLVFNIMTSKKDLYTILIIFVPLIVVPYVMLPFYVLLGSLDSLFNFRFRLLSKANEPKNEE